MSPAEEPPYIAPDSLLGRFPRCHRCNHLRGSHRPDGCAVVAVCDYGRLKAPCECPGFIAAEEGPC